MTPLAKPHAAGVDPLRKRRKAALEYINQQLGTDYRVETLARMAVDGGGPRFRKFGRFPLYETPDLDAWIRSRLSQSVFSTAELRPPNTTPPMKRRPKLAPGRRS